MILPFYNHYRGSQDTIGHSPENSLKFAEITCAGWIEKEPFLQLLKSPRIQESDWQLGCAGKREIGECFAQHRGELETMPAQSGRKADLRMHRMHINDKVAGVTPATLEKDWHAFRPAITAITAPEGLTA